MLKNKRLFFVIALIYTCVLLYFSLANANGIVPDTGLEFQDKIFHFGAYVGLAVLWGLFSFTFQQKKAILYSFIATFLFGIILELIQEKINPLRQYDILDLVANCLGVVIGTVIVVLYFNKRTLKK